MLHLFTFSLREFTEIFRVLIQTISHLALLVHLNDNKTNSYVHANPCGAPLWCSTLPSLFCWRSRSGKHFVTPRRDDGHQVRSTADAMAGGTCPRIFEQTLRRRSRAAATKLHRRGAAALAAVVVVKQQGSEVSSGSSGVDEAQTKRELLRVPASESDSPHTSILLRATEDRGPKRTSFSLFFWANGLVWPCTE